MLGAQSVCGTITLEAEELFFLAGILGSDRLLGIEDPFRGYLAEEIAEEWEKVKTSLINKGYLTQGDNGADLVMPPHIFSRVAIAGLAKRACWVRYSYGENAYEGYFHITDEKVVEVVKMEGSSTYRLEELGSVEEACEWLVERMMWTSNGPAEIPALTLSRKQFNELYQGRLELDLSHINKLLVRTSDDVEGALELAKCLKSCTAEGEFQLSVWDGQEWETQGAAYIVSEAMNWLIRKSRKQDEDWLIAILTTREQFQDMLLLWLKQPSEQEER